MGWPFSCSLALNNCFGQLLFLLPARARLALAELPVLGKRLALGGLLALADRAALAVLADLVDLAALTGLVGLADRTSLEALTSAGGAALATAGGSLVDTGFRCFFRHDAKVLEDFSICSRKDM